MILCQEGYRPGAIITEGLADGVIDGVIISPRYHGPADVGASVGDLRQKAPEAYLLLDPEFHLGLFTGDRVGKLAEYRHYHDNLSWTSFTGSRIGQYVDEVLSLQDGLPLSRVVSPGVAIGFLPSWQGTACLSLFEQTVMALGQPRARESLLLTLVVGDEVLSSCEAVDDLLNALTMMDCRGYYVIVDRQNSGDTMWCGHGQDVALGSLLYLLSTLSLNDYEVVCGYTDFAGILMLGSGASGVASGWFKKQRLFDSGRFAPSPAGGRTPKGSYASAPLMNWIPLSPDLEILDRADLADAVLSGAPHDALLGAPRREERWTLEKSVLTFWDVMQQAGAAMGGMDVEARFDYLNDRLATAGRLWDTIRTATTPGAALNANPTNIACWKKGLDDYRGRALR